MIGLTNQVSNDCSANTLLADQSACCQRRVGTARRARPSNWKLNPHIPPRQGHLAATRGEGSVDDQLITASQLAFLWRSKSDRV